MACEASLSIVAATFLPSPGKDPSPYWLTQISVRSCGSRRCRRLLGNARAAALKMGRPAFFVVAGPPFHRFRVVLNFPALRINLQFPVHLPCDVGQLDRAHV